MRNRLFHLSPLSSLIFFLIIACCSSGLIAREEENGYRVLSGQLYGMKLDSLRTRSVSNVTLVREAATFQLTSGYLYFVRPINGRTFAAFFTGEGTFTLNPPTDIEREQLFRFYPEKPYTEHIVSLFMMFGDSTEAEILRTSTPASRFPGYDEQQSLEYCLLYSGDEETGVFRSGIVSTLLNGAHNDYFFAHFGESKRDPFFFEIDPEEEEEVSFGRRLSGQFKYRFESISRFHRGREYADPSLQKRMNENVSVRHYDISAIIDDGLLFSASAAITMIPVDTLHRWFMLSLFEDLEVDSVRWGDGTKADWFKGEEDDILWVRHNGSIATGVEKKLTVAYHGDLFRKNLDYILSKSSIGWYPRQGYLTKALFDLTFRTPASMKFSAVGDPVSSSTEGEYLITTWRTPRPIRNASFSIGYFGEYAITNDSIPPVVVHMTSQYSGMDENVAADVANSLLFYQDLFGPSHAKRMTVWEIPAFHGEAFPEMIQLSSLTFVSDDSRGNDEIFRAHEVAHQWWPIGVDYRTYHDQWLSEGVCEYAGLMYMQHTRHDNDKFFTILKEWKQDILENRQYLFTSGQQAGPIWLGHRTNSSETEDDYGLIIYKKGAWVMHMLRNMMLDLGTMKEDRFRSFLRDLYATYRDSIISTEDFGAFLSGRFNTGMDWFIKQWIYETGIPSYTFAYKTEDGGNGKYKVTCRVRQSGVPDDFTAAVPLLIKFDGGKYIRLRSVVKGATSEFTLPLLPMEPEEIIFNDLESVLCEVDYVDW